MTSKLDEIRKKLQAADNNNKPRAASGETFPFWNLENDTSAKIRFLSDGNEDNTFFWVEKQIIRLRFPGIKGDDEHKEVQIQVPCMEMYGESCPILADVRPWWNDESLKSTASQYWKKRSYIFQGFVQTSDMDEKEVPENPIRKFVIGPQIFTLIKSSLLDPELDALPTDQLNGLDFTITKTQKGQYADYSTSKWARRETALTDEQLDAVKEHGVKDLNDWLPEKPTPEALGVIHEMFEASVNGELYDPERFAKYYRPWGFEYAGPAATSTPADKTAQSTSSKPAETPTPDESKVLPKVNKEVPVTSGSTSNAEDILAKIRNRR
jgi:hypothetical protein